MVFAGLTVAAALRYLIPMLSQFDNPFDGTEDQAEIDAYYRWINSGYMFSELLPWLATATLLAAVAALALAARRAQLQVAGSASATASRVASSAASVSGGSAESIS